MRHILKQLTPILQKSLSHTSNKQYINVTQIIGYPHQMRFCSTEVKDKRGTEIYCGALSPQIKSVKLFSITTSIAGIIGQPILLSKTAELGKIATGAAFCFVGFFTFVTPILLHLITKKYVTTLHYNEERDTYTATTITMFLTKREVIIV